MRKIGLLVAFGSLALFVAVGVALAAEINGTAGDDTLAGTGRSDTIFGYGGNDTINANGGSDQVWGGLGSDRVEGGAAKDTLHGEGGDDQLYGQGDDDELRGADGKDTLVGGGNNDRLYDRGDAAQDTFNCGSGTDTVEADPTDTVSSNCENVDTGGSGTQDRLPDLAMGRIGNIQISNTGTEKRLRFDSIIVNVGAGKFEMSGTRAPGETVADMTTHQRVYDSAGNYRDVSTSATFFWSGPDGHEHWHVRDLEDYTLWELDASSGNVVGDRPVVSQMEKLGFCVYDNENWGATTDAFYVQASRGDTTPGTGPSNSCSRFQPDALRVTMGLSRGWADNYNWNTFGQYLDVAGLPDGDYRLRISADESDRFLEEDETNNVTHADIHIQGNTVTVLGYGPSAPKL